MNTSLQGRVALVTGASRSMGIGAAICRQLASQGADIAFTHFLSYDKDQYDAPADGPAQLVSELQAMGVRTFDLSYDLSQSNMAPGLFDAVNGALGSVDILINNAAYSTHDSWETLTEESWNQHLNTNARATAMLTVEFARRFQKTEGGRVVNFSSGQHLGPMPNELAYISSKGAIIAFSNSIAPDLARKGITINVINPGATDTGWMSEELKAGIAQEHPMGRVGLPEDAARLVGWLATDEARWISGQVINSEGGIR